jgi:hypothetical protein
MYGKKLRVERRHGRPAREHRAFMKQLEQDWHDARGDVVKAVAKRIRTVRPRR